MKNFIRIYRLLATLVTIVATVAFYIVISKLATTLLDKVQNNDLAELLLLIYIIIMIALIAAIPIYFLIKFNKRELIPPSEKKKITRYDAKFHVTNLTAFGILMWIYASFGEPEQRELFTFNMIFLGMTLVILLSFARMIIFSEVIKGLPREKKSIGTKTQKNKTYEK